MILAESRHMLNVLPMTADTQELAVWRQDAGQQFEVIACETNPDGVSVLTIEPY